MLNFLFAFVICWVCKRFFIKEWHFGLRFNGILPGLKKYGLPAVIATAIVTIAFCVGLAPFDNRSTVWRVAVEGVVYYIGVAITEELYLRGLLQNIIKEWFAQKKNAALYAILITSALFGLGHIFWAIGQPLITVVAKTLWATALGIYFGAAYVVTDNLWVPIILHLIVNLCGIPFCYSTSNQYPLVALATCLFSYVALAYYGIYTLKKYPMYQNSQGENQSILRRKQDNSLFQGFSQRRVVDLRRKNRLPALVVKS